MGKSFKLRGYNTYTTPQQDSDRGLAILVQSFIPVKRIQHPIPCGFNVEVLAVTVMLQDHELDTYSVYRKVHHENTGELDLTRLFAHISSRRTLICSDFNAHHELLSSPQRANQAGEHIASALEDFPNVCLLNNGQATHMRGGRLDLPFLSKDLRHCATWGLHHSLTSDHFATVTRLQTPSLLPLPPPPPRWNQDLAYWSLFLRELEVWVSSYQPPDDVDLLEADLNSAIHRAANKAMPLKRPGVYTYKDSWYYCPEVRELKTRLNRVRKHFRRRSNAETLEILQVVKADVNQKLSQIRTEKWLEWCAKISQQSTLADIWKWLKRVSGRFTTPQPTHPDPQQEAERLAVNFAARTATANLPPGTQRLQGQLASERWREIHHAISLEDDTDAPYTIDELCKSFKRGKDTAPGHDKITYTMMRNLGPSGEEILLTLINKTHMEHVRPQVWNHQDTQPIPKPKDPQNPRPIALTSCLGKTVEKMVLDRLKYKVGPLHPHLYAYREGVGTTECITDVLSCINNKSAVVVFLDYEKTFELASPAVTLLSARKGSKGHLLAWCKSYLTNRQARVRLKVKG